VDKRSSGQWALAGEQGNCEGRQKSTNDKTKKPEPERSGDSNECIDYKDWIPASAESTPRIRKKYSGGE
jgi:hypothetical protein